MIPRATYRIQFHKGFTFADAVPLATYLAKLGISHLYSSPIATARAGSTHGYDAVDPTTINPELGGEEGFRALAAALKEHGIGIILDIVPNHVAVGGSDNGWWLDLLERGEGSDYARFFDVDWAPADPVMRGKILAPFLGAPYAEVLASGDLVLDLEPEEGRISVLAYGTHRFPIRPEDHREVLGGVPLAEADAGALRARFDGRSEEGRARLHALLDRQHYRLAWWRSAGDAINWRRFFDITELAGIRVEEPAVFDAVHALPLRLYAEGLIDGVRVDHVDGLADPAGYCRTLRARLEDAGAARPADAAPGPAYLVIEKILGPGETLSPDWQVDGTSGYDFMNEVSAVLHDPAGADALAGFWAEISGRPAEFAAEEHAARGEILTRNFAGQLDAAAGAFHRLAQSALETRDQTLAGLRRALSALLGAFPVYRTYATAEGAPASDARLRDGAVRAAMEAAGPADAPAVERIGRWLAGEGPGDRVLLGEAVRRFQQLSAPVAAKAVEDTAFYRYGRLLSRNDVGFDPARLGEEPSTFLARVAERATEFPHAMLATATHDHKRGEDVRARLAVLSEIPERWIGRARGWLAQYRPEGMDAGDAYQLFQTLVGAWPAGLQPDDEAGLAAFAERLSGWQQKALREGKLRSSWTVPNEDYERAAEQGMRRLLDPHASAAFLAELAGFVDEIALAGQVKSLIQTALRYTLPGVPDLYQGSEFWDLSLVDPDNRRPVDFAARIAALDRAAADRGDGSAKQQLIATLLSARTADPELFTDAALIPLELTGPRAGQALAFAREGGASRLIVLAAVKGGGIGPGWWGETQAVLPWADAPLDIAGTAGDSALAVLIELPDGERRLLASA